MGSDELIANLFRISQTEQKLKRDNIGSEKEANQIHILDVEYDEESVFRYLCILGEERIKNFNYKEAERLISLLIKKLGEKSNCKLTLKFILTNIS